MGAVWERGWFRLSLAVGGFGLLLLGSWVVLGNPIGAECHGRFDCFGLTAQCLEVRTRGEHLCTRSCEGPLDCPVGWACGDEPLLDRETQEVSVVRICSPLAPLR